MIESDNKICYASKVSTRHRMQAISKLLLPIGVTLALAIASYFLHIAGKTTLVQSSEIWQQRIVLHEEYYPFEARQFTTFTVRMLSKSASIPLVQAFVILQYTLFFCLGLAFYFYLRAIGFSVSWALFGQLLFLGSYPVLCAHFQPIYTWDDFWEYLALILAFYFVLKERLVAAGIVFAIGILARETTIMFYPVFAFVVLQRTRSLPKQRMSALLLPLIIFIGYMAITLVPPDMRRFINFDKNFLDPAWAKNSIFSFMVSFGVLWVILSASLIADARETFSDFRRSFLVAGALYSVPLVVLTTFTLTLARETRLFFPPFVFVIPLALLFLSDHRKLFTRFYSRWYGLPGLAISVAAFWLGQVVAPLLFPEFEFRAGLRITQIYFGIHLGLAVMFLLPLLEEALKHTPRLANQSETPGQIG